MAAVPKPESENGNSAKESDEENVVSMVDILEEEKYLEENANAVLGGSDDKNCTYLQGYLPRQALYACATCVPSGEEQAGVCLACSLECHDGHNLYELYTKRNFRCDCGNSKFKDFRCKLSSEKKPFNEDNGYNQNFSGVYCVCSRPYPDPEDEVEDEMIQCVMCEDWFHGRHLGREVPVDYEELTCVSCVNKCQFLMQYSSFHCVGEADTKVDVEKTDEEKNEGNEENSNKRKIENEDGTPAKKLKSDKSLTECKRNDFPAATVEPHTLFWKSGWRSALCTCEKCKALYAELGVSFLTNEKDSITAYEAKNQSSGASQYERGMDALSSMDRVQQVEVIQGYNDMKSALSDYLKNFADSGKVVSQEDIKSFFENLSKKPKAPGMQYLCK
ncbi:hypothetical protein CAPTEDRAFT_222324 [Capitella teleta]|uniref:UBR-type domain-containing protein n=1 Tax=Capitella teleta TaxID=283909 RepID=R7TZS7_CAPTE|nr:hypothetical protein CAPTEDRAFT_222324 [Capitella teleta]|eukprot:ELT99453.1 hypothetical protein CAPTEDRAFT_222324 [Capitella teleta]